MQFDPTFAMGHRSMFAWPDSSPSSNSMLSSSDFSSMTSGSEPSMTPPGGPKAMLPSPTEMKRHQDRSRRDSKMSVRLQRGNSVNSYTSTSPISIPDVSGAMSLPIYTTAPASVSMLSEPTASLSPPTYIPSYSPPMHEQPGGQVFGNSYQHTM